MSKGTIALLAAGAVLAGGGATTQSFEAPPASSQPEPAKLEINKSDLVEIGAGLGSIALVIGGVIGVAQIKKRNPYKAPKIKSQDMFLSKRKHEGGDEDQANHEH